MPKSKEQKQIEAIERKRNEIHNHRTSYLSAQKGGMMYEVTLAKFGLEKAEEQAAHYKRYFEKRCAEAKVDTHGNPI